ncbi:hypothetical protein MUP01_12500 [Candidatus Bathyarchaeota archaeon]|nr:hypothetical protein [Candidatus Bathyarchaeota archaeon]
MPEWVKRALTRRVERKGSRGKQQIIIIKPSDKIVYLVKFTLGMTACLSCLEVAHLLVLGRWNSEVFAAITGLVGTVTGVFIGQHA